MAISHSNHLFVLVAFVFYLLSPLVHASDSYNYTDSRQFKKNPAVSRHRNNIQWFPNYNWKPSDKYYDLRKETTEKKTGMEFTKPEDPEQRMADPWIKKMQEISRQEREKWAAYKRNENEKLALDNVEETTKASKLTNDESITTPIFSISVEYDEDIEETKVPTNLFEKSESSEINATIPKIFSRYPSMSQNSVKDFHDSFRLKSKQSTDATADGLSNKKLKSSRINMKNPSTESFQGAPVIATHQRHKDYEISDIKEDLSDKQNATTDYERSELEKNRLFNLIINSHPEESILQQSENQHIPKSHMNTHGNSKKFPERRENKNNFKKSLVEKYLIQSNTSRDNNEESKGDDEKFVTVNSLMQKRKRKRDDINLHPDEIVSQQSENRHIPKSLTNTQKNFKKFSKNNKNFNHKSESKELPTKEYTRQPSFSRNDNEKSSEDSERDEKIVTAKPLKSKEEKDDEKGKDTTEKPLNHRGFHPRWGMSVSSPPAEFLKDMSRRSMHRKNKEQTGGEKGERHHLVGRWGMNAASPPEEFLEDITMHQGHGTGRVAMKTGSKPKASEVKRSSGDRWPAPQNHQNLQTDLIQQLMIDKRNKEFTGKVPNSLYNLKYPRLNYWNNYPINDDLNDPFLKNLRFLMQVLQSYIWQDLGISMFFHIRIPYVLFRS